MAIGFFSLIFGYLAKLIPLKYFKSFRLNEEPMHLSIEEQMEHYTHSLRKSRTIHSRSFSSLRQHSSHNGVRPLTSPDHKPVGRTVTYTSHKALKM